MDVLQIFYVKSKGNGAAAISKRPRPTRPPANGPLFDARFRHLIDHLCRLGPRPVGECLLQLVGTGDDARTSLVVLLEKVVAGAAPAHR